MIRRWTQLVIGLFLFGMAEPFMVLAAVGVSPWDVLAQGVSKQTMIPFGWLQNIIGAVVLLLWIPIKQRPGLGTVLNVLSVGTVAQFGLWIVPAPEGLPLRIAYFAFGVALQAFATGMYISANLGPGPRDGLMTGLKALTGWPIWVVRTGIEATVLLIGWLLGGNVGFGTLAFCIFIGPLIQLFLPIFGGRRPKVPLGAPALRMPE